MQAAGAEVGVGPKTENQKIEEKKRPSHNKGNTLHSKLGVVLLAISRVTPSDSTQYSLMSRISRSYHGGMI